MRKTIAAVPLALALAAVGPATAATIEVPPPAPARAAVSWAPCTTEDDLGPCVWDARHMGNGEGRSFIARGDESIRYVSHRRAHRLLAGGAR